MENGPDKAIAMGKMGRMLMMMGIMAIAVAFVLGLHITTINADYWINTKSVREAAEAGSELVKAWRAIEIERSIMTALQGLGMGTLLMGIGMQLASILGVLVMQAKTMKQFLGEMSQSKPRG